MQSIILTGCISGVVAAATAQVVEYSFTHDDLIGSCAVVTILSSLFLILAS